MEGLLTLMCLRARKGQIGHMTSQKNNLDVSSNQELRLTSSITFEDFVEQYNPLLQKLTNKYYLPNHSPDDIKQIILQVMYRVWQTYEPDKGSSVVNYIYKSVGFVMKDAISKKRLDTVSIVTADEFKIDKRYIFADTENVEAKEAVKAFEEKLWAFVDTLKHGKTVRYYYKGKMTLQRIGDIQGISQEAVRLRLKTSYKKIREHFGDEIQDYLQNLDKT